tara:strand:- start:39766 stop:40365 length:600 start_codon:yes stop_codon:yes gene_type:complete
MKIGNIVTDKKIRVNKNINLVSSIDDIIEGIPTLVVGISNIKKIEPNPDFVCRKLSDTLYWTFNKDVRRHLFEEDLYYFTENCYKFLVSEISYLFVDMITYSKDSISKIFNKIGQTDKIITFKHKDMVYVYSDKYIFGVDLKQVKFIKGDVNKLMNKIKGLSSVFLDNERLFIKYNNELEILNNQIKYIPLLYSINNYE